MVRKMEKLYDLSQIEEMSGGDQNFVRRMALKFKDLVPIATEDLESHLSQHKMEHLAKSAHKLKSSIDALGIDSLKLDIRELEAIAKNGLNTNKLIPLVSNVIKVLKEVERQLEEDFAIN